MNQNWLRIWKTAAAAALALFICCFAAAKEQGFAEKMNAYSKTQKIAEDLLEKCQVQNRNTSEFWEKNIQKELSSAEKESVNEDRVDAMNKIKSTISDQSADKYAYIDRFMEDILNASMPEEKQLIFTIALLRQMEYFLAKIVNHESAKEAKDESREMLNEFWEKDVLENVQKRFEDEDLKIMVDDYLKLFPDEKASLLFTKGSDHLTDRTQCIELAEKCLEAFWQLDKVSATANFREWGKNMLNYLLLDHNEFMVKEFGEQYKIYKKVFKIAE